MRRSWVKIIRGALTLLGGWCMLQTGCLANMQREVEVLVAPAANPSLIHSSWLVDTFGPAILETFRQFW